MNDASQTSSEFVAEGLHVRTGVLLCGHPVLCCRLLCFADADRGGCAGGERVETSARRRLPPAVLQPHVAVYHVRNGYASAGNDAVDHHLRLHGLP